MKMLYVLPLLHIDTSTVWYRIVHLRVADVLILYSVSATALGVAVQYVDAGQARTILIAYIAVANAIQVSLHRERRTTDITVKPTSTDTTQITTTQVSKDV